MNVGRLDLRRFRGITDASLHLQPGFNLLLGPNGAGKTTVLEALHLLAYGRSFRGRVRDGLVQAGAEALETYVEWTTAHGVARRAGLRHTGSDWSGRLDGESVPQLGDLCAALAVVTFEPGSHELVHGGSDGRRRFLDWGLFHVEPGFLLPWRRYARALKQRNALLKRGIADYQLDAWDQELAGMGVQLDAHRRAYVSQLAARLGPAAASLAPALGMVDIRYRPGWRADDLSLADALLNARDRDLAMGYTSVGPHRGDWDLQFERLPGREALSRGQGKLVALSCLIAQHALHAAVTSDAPVFAIDDLASELDAPHQERLIEHLLSTSSQIIVSGTGAPAALPAGVTLFHVEQGTIRAAA